MPTSAIPYRLLADAILVLHVGVVVFVVAGLLLIIVGNRLGWRRVNGWWFRIAHLSVIGIVVLQAWLGRLCPLTTLESWLRVRAGDAAYTQSFIEHWLQRLLYYEAPLWVFALAYTLFALLVIAVWIRYPPVRSMR